MAKKKQVSGGSSTNSVDNGEPKWDLKSIRKDIEYLGSAHMSWKEKKELENRKVVSLGGKPPKGQRLPLSVARVMMKKQKEREAKKQEENLILGRFGGSHSRDGKRADRRKQEERILKSTEGYFRNGVLDVKNLLKSSNSRAKDDGMSKIKRLTGEPKKSKGGKKKKKNGKKGGKKRR